MKASFVNFSLLSSQKCCHLSTVQWCYNFIKYVGYKLIAKEIAAGFSASTNLVSCDVCYRVQIQNLATLCNICTTVFIFTASEMCRSKIREKRAYIKAAVNILWYYNHRNIYQTFVVCLSFNRYLELHSWISRNIRLLFNILIVYFAQNESS